MFRLDNLLEQWAVIYTPLSHDPSASAKPKDRSFFRIDRLDMENEWTRNQNLITHPCLCFPTAIDAEIDRQKPKHLSRAWGIYLMVPQQSVNNAQQTGIEATECKIALDQMASDLMAFLSDLQDFCANGSWPRQDTPGSVRRLGNALTAEERQQVRGLRLEQTRWWSTPMSFSKWWILGMEIESLDPRPLCIIPSRYADE